MISAIFCSSRGRLPASLCRKATMPNISPASTDTTATASNATAASLPARSRVVMRCAMTWTSS